MFLLDTDVLSALRRRERNPETVRWVETQRYDRPVHKRCNRGRNRARHYATAATRPVFRQRASCMAGSGVGLVQRPNTSRRYRHGTAVGTTVGDTRTQRCRPTHCRHCARARSDCRNPQRPRFRANRGPCSKSYGVRDMPDPHLEYGAVRRKSLPIVRNRR